MVETSDILGISLLATSTILAFACGFFLWKCADVALRAQGQRAVLAEGQAEILGDERDSRGMDVRVLRYAKRLSQAASMGACRRLSPRPLVLLMRRRADTAFGCAGLGDSVNAEGLCETQVRLAAVGGCIGLLIGLLFSPLFGALLFAVGMVLGFRMPLQALERRRELRAHEAERHLPEMLDVIALGMRSGLSFDASLRLYARHFDTMLSRELANAQRQWSSGLALRDDALRTVASTYDSVIFGRVVETVIRSVRYGSSMVESLESDAAEARTVYQSRREERVAKAPVKMMIPTGVLILPAMLIMVLGPVLLELMEGGL